jgi:predicted transcriptional regulator YdeE
MNKSIRELPEMKAICFEGYSPDPEMKAFSKMEQWIRDLPEDSNRRIFGHNIDTEGNLSFDPRNAGYKVLVTVDDFPGEDEGLQTEIVKPGKFLVVSTGGKIESAGQWIMEGWQTINQLIEKDNLKVKDQPRWFEEHLGSSDPDSLMMDLYLELE